ncbi:hypothetical protein, partial [Trichothermofontia sp.]
MVRSFWPSSLVCPWHRLLGSTCLTVMLASPALAQAPEAPSAEASPLPTTELEALLPTVPPDVNSAAAPVAPT